jgi:hypothetical protein
MLDTLLELLGGCTDSWLLIILIVLCCLFGLDGSGNTPG